MISTSWALRPSTKAAFVKMVLAEVRVCDAVEMLARGDDGVANVLAY
jgi:hypothetical protein